jgi:hypothetical protein
MKATWMVVTWPFKSLNGLRTPLSITKWPFYPISRCSSSAIQCVSLTVFSLICESDDKGEKT